MGHPADRQSKVNLYQPDLNLYPMFNECTGYEIVLQPGDVLYIPNLWFHHFENLSTPCISVNFWFKVSTKECAHIIIYYTIHGGEEHKKMRMMLFVCFFYFILLLKCANILQSTAADKKLIL